MEPNVNFRKKIIGYLLAGLLSVIFALLAYKAFTYVEQYYGKLEASDDDDVYAYRADGPAEFLIDGKWYAEKDKLDTYLLIGIDKYQATVLNEDSFRNTEQADAMFLLSVDHNAKTYHILSINRDTMASIRALDLKGNPFQNYEGQLALSHTYGSGKQDSCENTVWSVSNYLYGLQINHYASISMDAVKILNDSIGGVSLTVPEDYTVVDPAFAPGKTVTLQGDLALKYVRMRGELTDSSNLARMERQMQYINAFLEQAKVACQSNDKLSGQMLLDVSEYLISDCTVEQLLSLTDVLQKYELKGIDSIKGEAKKGQRYMEFRPDEESLKAQILDLYFTCLE